MLAWDEARHPPTSSGAGHQSSGCRESQLQRTVGSGSDGLRGRCSGLRGRWRVLPWRDQRPRASESEASRLPLCEVIAPVDDKDRTMGARRCLGLFSTSSSSSQVQMPLPLNAFGRVSAKMARQWKRNTNTRARRVCLDCRSSRDAYRYECRYVRRAYTTPDEELASPSRSHVHHDAR